MKLHTEEKRSGNELAKAREREEFDEVFGKDVAAILVKAGISSWPKKRIDKSEKVAIGGDIRLLVKSMRRESFGQLADLLQKNGFVAGGSGKVAREATNIKREYYFSFLDSQIQDAIYKATSGELEIATLEPRELVKIFKKISAAWKKRSDKDFKKLLSKLGVTIPALHTVLRGDEKADPVVLKFLEEKFSLDLPGRPFRQTKGSGPEFNEGQEVRKSESKVGDSALPKGGQKGELAEACIKFKTSEELFRTNMKQFVEEFERGFGKLLPEGIAENYIAPFRLLAETLEGEASVFENIGPIRTVRDTLPAVLGAIVAGMTEILRDGYGPFIDASINHWEEEKLLDDLGGKWSFRKPFTFRTRIKEEDISAFRSFLAKHSGQPLARIGEYHQLLKNLLIQSGNPEIAAGLERLINEGVNYKDFMKRVKITGSTVKIIVSQSDAKKSPEVLSFQLKMLSPDAFKKIANVLFAVIHFIKELETRRRLVNNFGADLAPVFAQSGISRLPAGITPQIGATVGAAVKDTSSYSKGTAQLAVLLQTHEFAESREDAVAMAKKIKQAYCISLLDPRIGTVISKFYSDLIIAQLGYQPRKVVKFFKKINKALESGDFSAFQKNMEKLGIANLREFLEHLQSEKADAQVITWLQSALERQERPEPEKVTAVGSGLMSGKEALPLTKSLSDKYRAISAEIHAAGSAAKKERKMDDTSTRRKPAAAKAQQGKGEETPKEEKREGETPKAAG